MLRVRSLGLFVIIMAAGFITAAEPAAPPKTVKIGMLKSMFRDVPPQLFNAMTVPFQTVVESQTGLKGQLVVIDTPEEMTHKLSSGEVQLGVYHGFEFAWMKLQEKNLEPLMLVTANPNLLKATVVVQKDLNAAEVGDCRGQRLTMPMAAKEHSRLYLSRRCRQCGAPPQEFFAATKEPVSVEEALDQVVDGVANVAIVDQAAVQMFERRKPGRFARLKVIETSQPFPASVIAYCNGQLDVATQQKFQKGMSTAHQAGLGKHLMGLMKITGFEPVPANYGEILAVSIKDYPPGN
jgi:ABC-type phosphate/phosphonate transport system substrate-binding protein